MRFLQIIRTKLPLVCAVLALVFAMGAVSLINLTNQVTGTLPVANGGSCTSPPLWEISC